MSEHIWSRKDHDQDLRLDFGFAQLALYTAKSPQKLGHNEDALCVIPLSGDSGVLAVADGVGGQRNAAEAAEIALGSLEEVLSKHKPKENLRETILDAIELANTRIMKMGVGAGTTLVVVEFCGYQIRPYNVGDSCILVVGSRGALVYKNTPHSPVGYALEAGMLGPSEALHHEDSHLVLNVLGSESMSIEVGPVIQMRPRDSLILASDGLTDNIQIPELIEKIRKGSFEKTALELFEYSQNLMKSDPIKSDDLSFILARKA